MKTVPQSYQLKKQIGLHLRSELENLISKFDIGPVKLPGLSRNGPLISKFSGLIMKKLNLESLLMLIVFPHLKSKRKSEKKERD